MWNIFEKKGNSRKCLGLGKTIAVANQKGGVGKTTTTVNLSAWLSLLGKKVLLVDIDPQANTTSGLGINKNNLEGSIYNVLIENVPAAGIWQKISPGNLFIIPSGVQLAGAEIELVGIPEREKLLKKCLQEIKADFDFILIDCPPSLGLLTINALTAADSVLIPIQCEYYALEGLSQLINTIQLIKKRLNHQLEIEGVLLTMFDGRTNLSIQVVDEVKKFFKEKVYKTIIPRNVRLSEAPSHGKPVMLYDKRSRGAELYHELAIELLDNTLGSCS